MPSIFPSPTSPAGAPSQPQGAPGDAIPNALGYRHPRYYAQIESGPGTNSWSSSKMLDWREVVLNQDGQDDSAQFVIGMLDSDRAYSALTPQDWDHWFTRMLPDRRLRVVSPVGDGTILFQGYAMVDNLAWQPGTHSMAITAISEGQELARTSRQTQIRGRAMRRRPWTDWMQEEPDDQLVDSMPVAFNEGGLPNRIADTLPFKDGILNSEGDEGIVDVHLFDDNDGKDAAYWTYGQALRYLVLHYVMAIGGRIKGIPFMADTDEISDAVAGDAATDPLLSKLNARVPDVSVESLSVDEAIRMLTARAGLHYRWAITPRINAENNQADFRLRVYSTIANEEEESATDPAGNSQMGAPKTAPLHRQEPFADITADTPRDIAQANRIQAASIIRDARGFNSIMPRGGVFEYQVGVMLRPGWLPTQFLDNITFISVDDGPPPATGVSFDAAVDYWGGRSGEFDPEYDRDTLGNLTRVPRSKFHALHPEHGSAVDPNPVDPLKASKVSDVFRLWVFPDSTAYMNADAESDYQRPTESFQNAFDADWYKPFDATSEQSIFADLIKGSGLDLEITETWVPRNRPFRNLIGRRNISSTDQSPIVLINFVDNNILSAANGLGLPPASSNWVEYEGAIEIDEKRAAIRFAESNIWNGTPFLVNPNWGPGVSEKAMELYMQGKFWVAIIATVQSDFRLGDQTIVTRTWDHTRERVRTMDYGLERFQERISDLGADTILTHVPETNPAFMSRDDFFAFNDQADADAKFLGVTKWAGDPEAWFIDTEVRVGDSATGIDGLGIDFVPYTSVQSVRYVKNAASGGSYRTTMHLTDLRTAPEVNSE